MKNRLFFTCLALVALGLPLGCNLNGFLKPEISRFEWMVGNRMDTASGFFEYWKLQGDSALTGNGYKIAAGDTIFSETLTIKKDNGEWAYIVHFRNDESRFILKNNPGDSLVFDNPENEFPKRISYIRKKNGIIAASIENPGYPEKKNVFQFIPIKE